MIQTSAILQKLLNKEDLVPTEMAAMMTSILENQLTAAQIAGFLIALRSKGESIAEMTAAAKTVKKLAIPIHFTADHLVDIVGTGGDQAKTFNISTTSSFVAAAAGAIVAKHNNRAISSSSGSVDVLEIAGINLNLTPSQIEHSLKELGLGFMFAPQHHPAWKTVAAVRRELGVRTLFNLLGPLANPANVPNLLVGVPAAEWVNKFAEVFLKLGQQHVMVVHSDDGLDEISIAAPTQVAELQQQQIRHYQIQPEQFGFSCQPLDSLRVENPAQSLAIMQSVFANVPSPARDIVILNAGAAIYVANVTNSLTEGIQKAALTIASGAAKQKFEAFKNLSLATPTS